MMTKLQQEYKRVTKYVTSHVMQLPVSYVVDDYTQLMQVWDGLSITPDMADQLAKARQKTISADAIIKLNDIITAYNNNHEQIRKPDKQLKKSFTAVIDRVRTYISEKPGVRYTLHIEHGLSTTNVHVELQDSEGRSVMIPNEIDFKSIWGILEAEPWNELNDLFRGIFLDDIEFIEEFQYAFKLQSYLQINGVFQGMGIFKPNNSVLPKGMKIVIGQHDGREFECNVE